MEKGLNKRWMGILFAILITISFGIVFNAVQSNTITVAFQNSFGLDRLTVGIIMAVILPPLFLKVSKRLQKHLNILSLSLPLLTSGLLSL